MKEHIYKNTSIERVHPEWKRLSYDIAEQISALEYDKVYLVKELKQINRKNNEINFDDTPTITYIIYVDNYPIGYICLRTKINEQWRKWSGNFYYQVRSSERRKGYATKMLSLGLEKLKEMGFNEVYGQSSKGNIGSQKTIENNNGILLDEVEGTHYYKIKLWFAIWPGKVLSKFDNILSYTIKHI